jgi:hypothetical protein
MSTPTPCSPATAAPALSYIRINRRVLLPNQLRVWLIGLVTCLVLAAPASATDYTWTSGEHSSSWSEGANWQGGVAPVADEAIGTLTFGPALAAINFSENDLPGLSANGWQINDGHEYLISGEPLSLGSGGLTITAPELSAPSTDLTIPLTLASSQRWQFSGGEVPEGQHVTIGSAVSGESANLTIGLNGAATWMLLGSFPGSSPSIDDELGDVTVEGVSEPVFELGAGLNATDGHSVTLKGVNFYASSITTGSLISEDAAVHVALASLEQFGPALLSVQSASLDGGSSLAFAITGSGDQAGKSYSQLQSGGPVDLGGASLELYGTCPSLPVGEVLTLISTTGSLSGSFGNAANGGVVSCGAVHYQISYHMTGSPQTVTATVVASGGGVPTNTQPPTISGSVVEGQTLSESRGSWSNSPTSYTYQWQRCDVGGNNCQVITGATAQSYILTAADVGSTVRAQETASNGEGASTPEVSAPTAVVQVAPAVGSSGGGSTSSGSTAGSSTIGSTEGSGGRPAATISAAQIAALLGQQLVPSGKAAKIGALLKNGGLTMPFKALEAGMFVVGWYEASAGAKLAKHSKAKLVLVASGQMTFSTAGTGKLKMRLTAAGRKLLKHAKTVKLTARGVFAPTDGVPVAATQALVVRN